MEGGNLRVPQDLKVGLAVAITSRDGTFAKDSYLQNLYIEASPDEKKYIQKRAGSASYTTFGGGGGGVCQGMWNYKDYIVTVADNTLYRIISPTSLAYTLGSAWGFIAAPTWQGRCGAACAYFNGQLFVIGGQTAVATTVSDVWASSDGGLTWIQLVSAAPWGTRSGQKAVVFNDRLYIMGGFDNVGTYYNDVWVTDDGVNWTLVTANAGWSPRTFPVAVVYNNGIWVLGGSGPLNDVWFSTDGATWVKMVANAAWAARSGHAAVVFQGKLWVIGGTVGGREVWWTVDGITWTMTTNVAFTGPKYLFGCCVYNNRIYVACGYNATLAAYTADVWSSADGINWAADTAAFGGSARGNCELVVGITPNSAIRAPTMFLIGGTDLVPNYLKEVFTANINGTLSTSWALPPPATTPYLPMQAATHRSNDYLVIKDTRGAYIFHANAISAVQDKNYPAETVPGIVNLDETLYVMDPTGLIMGSAVNDPNTWPSRNYLGADYESDKGVVLLKYSNFVMAIGEYTTQFFVNTGAPGGTLLRPVKQMNAKVGGRFPYAAINIEDTVIWLGRSRESKSLQVFQMVGSAIKPVSYSAIDRIISSWASTDNVKATPIKAKGHSFYVLTNITANISLAYDINDGLWYRWTFGGVSNAYYAFTYSATDGINTYLLHNDFKWISTLEPTNYFDASNNTAFLIQCRIVTPLVDNGTNLRKTCGGISLICDRVASSTVTFEYSKDDYQTWSNAVTVNVDQERVHMNRIGKYRRIAYRITHIATTAFRVESLETEVRIGN